MQYILYIDPKINSAFLDMTPEQIKSTILDKMLDWAGPSSVDQLSSLSAIDLDSAKINADGRFEVGLKNVTSFGIKSNAVMADDLDALCRKCISLTPSGTTLPPRSYVFLKDPSSGISTLPQCRRL